MHARLLSFLFMASLLLGSGSPSVASALPARQGNRQQWGARFDDPLHSLDAAVDVDVNPGGDTVYVTGGAGHDPSTGEDFATIAYRTQGGRPLWLSWYNG